MSYPDMPGYLAEHEEVRRIVQLYIDGANGDVEKLKEAFHPTAHMHGEIGSLGLKSYYPVQNFIDMVAEKPGMAGANYKAYVRNIEISGDAGVAVLVQTDYLGCDFIDYLSVAKVDGRWWIVNKTFACTGKSPQK